MTAYGTQLRPRQDQLLAHAGTAALVSNMSGLIEGPTDGFFLDACRLLSTARLRIDGKPPEVFSAARFGPTGILAHGRFQADGDLLEDALFARTQWTVGRNALQLAVTLTNYASSRRRPIRLSLEFNADFADFQETQKGSRQQCAPVEVQWDDTRRQLRFDYRHPKLPLSTVLTVLPAGVPLRWADGHFEAEAELEPQAQLSWEFEIVRDPLELPAAVLSHSRPAVRPPDVPTLTTSNATVARA